MILRLTCLENQHRNSKGLDEWEHWALCGRAQFPTGCPERPGHRARRAERGSGALQPKAPQPPPCLGAGCPGRHTMPLHARLCPCRPPRHRPLSLPSAPAHPMSKGRLPRAGRAVYYNCQTQLEDTPHLSLRDAFRQRGDFKSWTSSGPEQRRVSGSVSHKGWLPLSRDSESVLGTNQKALAVSMGATDPQQSAFLCLHLPSLRDHPSFPKCPLLTSIHDTHSSWPSQMTPPPPGLSTCTPVSVYVWVWVCL